MSDSEIIEFEKAINKEYMMEPLLSPLSDFTLILAEYKEDTSFHASLLSVSKTHQVYRTRKDGNCFYRAFSFKLLSLLRLGLIELPDLSKLHSSYDPDIILDFHNILVSLADPNNEEHKDLLQALNVSYQSDTIVAYLRILLSSHLLLNFEYFSMFLDRPLDEFVRLNVDPMNVEADEIQIVALADVFKLRVRVATVEKDGWRWSELGSGEQVVEVLYRPGHYDLLD